MQKWQQIVVGYDGSDCSRRALKWAHGVALDHDAQLLVITAWLPQPLSPAAPQSVFVAGTDVRPEESAEQVLADALREEVGTNGDVVRSEVIKGHPAKVLIDRSSGADLVVVGSHGHGFFQGMLLGSVSQHLVAHARCAVVVVR